MGGSRYWPSIEFIRRSLWHVYIPRAYSMRRTILGFDRTLKGDVRPKAKVLTHLRRCHTLLGKINWVVHYVIRSKRRVVTELQWKLALRSYNSIKKVHHRLFDALLDRCEREFLIDDDEVAVDYVM